VHWQHPRFFAYFAANASFPGMLADMLCGALGMIGFSWAASPISTELEMVRARVILYGRHAILSFVSNRVPTGGP